MKVLLINGSPREQGNTFGLDDSQAQCQGGGTPGIGESPSDQFYQITDFDVE